MEFERGEEVRKLINSITVDGCSSMPGHYIKLARVLPVFIFGGRGRDGTDIPALASAVRSSFASKWPFPSFDPASNHQGTRVQRAV
jgi:hypothetical protein